MKRKDLEKILAPLIREQIDKSVKKHLRRILFESEALSTIIQEVAAVSVGRTLMEQRQYAPQPQQQRITPQQQQNGNWEQRWNQNFDQVKEKRRIEAAREARKQSKKLNESVGRQFGGVNIFDDTMTSEFEESLGVKRPTNLEGITEGGTVRQAYNPKERFNKNSGARPGDAFAANGLDPDDPGLDLRMVPGLRNMFD